MKKVISTVLLGSVTSLMAMYGEQAYLYKDNRILGMGGANVAVGGYSTSIFYNPAGLSSIEKQEGFVVDLLGLQASGSDKFKDFSSDLSDAMDITNDTEQTIALIKVLQKYNGDHFHANVTNYTSISKHSDAFAWSVGLLVGADANYMTHSDGSEEGSSLETTSRGYGGVVLGVSKDFSTDFGVFDIGVSGKFVKQKSYEGLIPIADLLESNDIVTLLQDNYEKDATGYGVDVGVIYHPFPKSAWHPTFGLSVLNIGGMKMDDNYGRQPMTVNLGVAIAPEVPFAHKLVAAVDYVDILSANQVRVYGYNPNDNEAYTYKEADDTDLMKKIRAGVMAQLVNNSWFGLTLNGGMYQGAWTAGVDMTLTILKLSLASYEENLGYGSVDITDRRYALQLGIGW